MVAVPPHGALRSLEEARVAQGKSNGKLCGARTRSRNGEPCQQPALANGRCRFHGGKSLSGPANPAWIDGRASDVLPKRMLDDYHRSRQDPDKLALDNELALIDARMIDVLRRVESGESGQLWRILADQANEYELARAAKDGVLMAQSVNSIIALIRRGNADHAAWSEVMGLVERRRKIAESERKRLIQQHQVVGTEVAMALLGQLVTVVKEHVQDDDAIRAISDEYARLVGA